MSSRFAAVYPELVHEWSERNNSVTPDKIAYGSNRIIWQETWIRKICECNDEEWMKDENTNIFLSHTLVGILSGMNYNKNVQEIYVDDT